MKFLLLITLLTGSAFAKLKVKDLKFSQKNNRMGLIKIFFDGKMTEAPELTVKRNNILQVVMPESVVWPVIDKKITLNDKFDTGLKAYQFDKNTVRVRTILPYQIKNVQRDVSLLIKDQHIEMTFPLKRIKGISKKQIIKPQVKNKNVKKLTQKKNTKKSEYDEKYLDYLLTQKSDEPMQKAKKKTSDKVSTTQAGTEKFNETEKFSVTSYIGKYVAFLGLILLVVYGFVVLMKKGVLKKGKLGFLNNTDMVTVLNTSYIAPKRSVVMVQVHNKVLLLGNSDAGLTFLTELDDVADILKTGEKKIAGDNFDTNISTAQTQNLDEFIKVKENPFAGQNTPVSSEALKTEDKVSFSSQIKNKIKDLKPLQ